MAAHGAHEGRPYKTRAFSWFPGARQQAGMSDCFEIGCHPDPSADGHARPPYLRRADRIPANGELSDWKMPKSTG